MTEEQELIIQRIATIREQNRQLWSKLGYPPRSEDPVPDILRKVAADETKKSDLKLIAMNDEAISYCFWKLLK